MTQPITPTTTDHPILPQLRRAAHRMPGGILLLDEQDVCVFSNAQAAHILGQDGLQGRALREVFADDETILDFDEIDYAAQSGILGEYDAFSQSLNRWFAVQLCPTDPGIAIFLHDITKYRHIQRLLALSQQFSESESNRMKAVLGLLPVGVFICDRDGRIVEVNEAGRALWEIPEQAAPPATDAEYRGWRADGTTIPAGESGMMRALRGEQVFNEEILIETFAGRQRAILNSALPVYDDDGVLINAVSVSVDITERKQLEQTQEELSRLKDLFIDTATHELRNPLSVIQGYIRLMEVDVDEGSIVQVSASGDGFIKDLSRALRVLDEQILLINRLVDDMMTASHMQHGQLTLDMQPGVDIATLVEETVRQFALTRPHHTFTVDLPQHALLLLVTADKGRLQQVLNNLLGNAAKYSPEGTQVAVTVRMEGESACVAVRDEGAGISPETQKHLFERFYRVPDKKMRRVTGLGLGLYISHEIIRQHGGTLSVQSAVGEGSTFTFCLPLSGY